jgi:Periplasmic copper-binding protein (NosD)
VAVTGATTGIRAIDSAEELTVTGSWLGVKLDGSNGSGATTGIWLDPGSDEAAIGGIAAGDRNVFANNAAEGLDIEGASEAVVRGNYFGVKPDGETQAANGKDIEITDTIAFEATGNEVGATVEGAALGSAACDGGCNVISGATSTGIDLQGNGGNEAPATGPTTLHGNYMGLNAAGTAVVANATYGVFSGGAEDVTIGGSLSGDANYLAGGGTGIYHESGEGFEAVGNAIGSSPSVAELTAPGLGMFVFCLSNAEPVAVDQNTIRMDGGIAIEERFGAAEITQNFIEGAEYGVFTRGNPPVVGNLIESNVIGKSTASGILIENDLNEVLHNAIYGSAAAGVRIQNPASLVIATENRIGGDLPSEENTIRENGGDAIEIVDTSGSTEEDSENEVARNHGGENGDLFIDLVGNANAGILPPVISTAALSGASGSGAEPGATIRVFRKATASAGEIASFLGEATADGSGNWSVSYAAAIPGETRIAASQTSAGGTSELAFASTEPESSSGGGGSGGESSGGAPPAPPVAPSLPPQTKITKGPKAKSKARTAKFKFSSNQKGSRFECKLDKKPFKPCRSPKTYKRLKPGRHVFKVRAVNSAGTPDPTPAKKKFRIVP